ncbi:hypothetical protein [Sphaerisporangium sp. TRM90804]|uniref:GNAT family N-acetyltransferase n=1 Tax=Sphaerisporangium sp. TRM90804 TaxID=3031113 RepID=UPI0024485ED2|nr:hypothetical protein [Sphaerisporangium sp. TRM90804]MDH2430572.1 hypothetical protein [Sphaerisporangium sp. TRM90804]
MIRELSTLGDVLTAAGDDLTIVWAAQDMRPGTRAFALGEAVAVAAPALARRDRLVVAGPLDDVAPLVRHALAEVGPAYRPMGDEGLVRALAERVERVRFEAAFLWMQTAAPAPGEVGKTVWLEDADTARVSELLAVAAPGSYAVPGVPGVRRWAGMRADSGELVSVAADAWSCSSVGFIAGVATAGARRRRGHSEAVCRFVLNDLMAAHGRVALMADSWNGSAVGVYERLGMSLRNVAAAHAD